MIGLLIVAQVCGWLAGVGLAVRMILADQAPAASNRHLWIVQSDTVSGVRAMRDTAPYDWATDECSGDAA